LISAIRFKKAATILLGVVWETSRAERAFLTVIFPTPGGGASSLGMTARFFWESYPYGAICKASKRVGSNMGLLRLVTPDRGTRGQQIFDLKIDAGFRQSQMNLDIESSWKFQDRAKSSTENFQSQKSTQ
jgi:hypothetical protein